MLENRSLSFCFSLLVRSRAIICVGSVVGVSNRFINYLFFIVQYLRRLFDQTQARKGINMFKECSLNFIENLLTANAETYLSFFST